MPFPYYDDKDQNKELQSPVPLPVVERFAEEHPSNYIPDSGLVDAVNVALILGQPLLITGEPGTGKTQLASHIAWKLGLYPSLKFETKSTSTARDLFYTYDAISRFQASQEQKPIARKSLASDQARQEEASRQADEALEITKRYIRFNALGLAILRAESSDVSNWLPADFAMGGSGKRSVVLIDEIDKAPRDFPNDILNEIEGMYFRVPELRNQVFKAKDDLRPITILTSNSEKHLPDAFLRRCVFYNIPPPTETSLARIVKARIKAFDVVDPGNNDNGNPRLLDDAIRVFADLRKPASGLHKRPSTAELLGSLRALLEIGIRVDQPIDQKVEVGGANRPAIEWILSVLAKNTEDQALASNLLTPWKKSTAAAANPNAR